MRRPTLSTRVISMHIVALLTPILDAQCLRVNVIFFNRIDIESSCLMFDTPLSFLVLLTFKERLVGISPSNRMEFNSVVLQKIKFLYSLSILLFVWCNDTNDEVNWLYWMWLSHSISCIQSSVYYLFNKSLLRISDLFMLQRLAVQITNFVH